MLYRETPPSALTAFERIFVDDWSQVKHHGADVSWRAVDEGVIAEEKITGELGEVVVGKKIGRASASDKIFFNPTSPDFSPAKMITYSRSTPVNYSSLCLLG